MTPEVLLAAGYAIFLVVAAAGLEWLSQITHKRSLNYRTFGFDYDEVHDHWTCPEGQHLWPHEFDHERRVVRYRAKAHICNGCPRKENCTDSDRGREVTRALDPWPHSEAGRFHRGLALTMVVLAVFVLVVELVRNHAPGEAALLLGLLLLALVTLRFLIRDFVRHPAGFPEPMPSHGLRMARSRWASENRELPR